MFGTLVVQLPSEYEGGALVVHHQNKELIYNFSGIDGCSGFHFAAFYADCEHEVQEVQSGYRLCLIYNLVCKGMGGQPFPADNRSLIDEVVAAMREWDAQSMAPNSEVEVPQKIALVLDHHYCRESLSFHALKNIDRARADLMTSAQQEFEFDLYLTQITWNQEWSADCYYDRFGSNFEAGELMEESVNASGWVCPAGEQVDFGELSFDQDEVVPEDVLNEMDPDEEDCQEATGNEGATMERWYHRAALVVWPKHQRIAVLGVQRMITHLKMAIDKSPANESNLQLARRLVVLSKQKPPDDAATGQMLHCLKVLAVPEVAVEFMTAVSFKSSTFSDELLGLCNKLGWGTLLPGLKAMFEKCTGNLVVSVELLSKLVGKDSHDLPHDKRAVCQQLASVLGNLLQAEGDAPPASANPERHSYMYMHMFPSTRTKAFVCDVLQIFCTCGQRVESVLETIMMQPNRYPVTTVLVPVLEEMHSSSGPGCHTVLATLLPHCISVLEAATAQTIATPSTWAMPYAATCACTDCQKLGKFVKDPAARVEHFKVNKSRRFHLHRIIESLGAGGDLNHVTERVGSPQTLVITKTHKSVEQKRKKHANSLAMLNRLLHMCQCLQDATEPATKRPKY